MQPNEAKKKKKKTAPETWACLVLVLREGGFIEIAIWIHPVFYFMEQYLIRLEKG